MLQKSGSTRSSRRVLAYTSLAALAWAICHNWAFADGRPGTAEIAEDSTFLAELFRTLFTFDSHGLLNLLGNPRYYVPAFIAVNVIVFVETGLLVGFFLPGDSLLVITGLI